MDREEWIRRLWEKDPSLWKNGPGHEKIIRNSLGWLTVPVAMREQVEELKDFAEQVRGEGFRHLLLLGMGGSSLCPEVFRRTFGRREGFPELLVLDSTDPAAVRNTEARLDLSATLFIVASKSGTTTEPQAFHQYFFHLLSQRKGPRAGDHFLAITDPGTPLQTLAQDQGFRRVFLNPSDIGGRYSALSSFGLVPAALMGLDIGKMLERADRIEQLCGPSVQAEENPAARLGAAMGALARKGRDKLTLIASPPLDSLGLWIEQLVAESTGKEGRGILPVAGEALGPPAVYGKDRLFVFLRSRNGDKVELEARRKDLEAAGHPVIQHRLEDPWDLGEEFFLWEMATALAGALLEINPFDQPNVQESKDRTRKLLEGFLDRGHLDELPVVAHLEEGRLQASRRTRDRLQQAGMDFLGRGSLSRALRTHLSGVQEGDYIAITAYLAETSRHDSLLQEIRTHLRDSLKVATTVGYGPRFLHSTGQLHKGGPDKGLFLQLTAEDAADLPIPAAPYSFGTLKQAQAIGDFQSLDYRNRPVLSLHLRSDVTAGLQRLRDAVRDAFPLEPPVR